jgi:hypothetical protein
MQDAAEALQQHQQAGQTNSSGGSSSSELGQQQQQQLVLVQQLADMLFAMAVHAVDCEATAAAATVGSSDGYDGHSSGSSSSSRGAIWYLSTGCVTLMDAAASYSSAWDFTNIARGVSSKVSGAWLWQRCVLSGVYMCSSSFISQNQV